MKKIVLLTAVAAGIFAFSACNSARQDASAEEAEIQLVAKPDFVFTSGNTTLFSTFATKADPVTEPEPKDENVNVEVNLSVCPVQNKEITASKLSVHIRTANDVTVFLPVAPSVFSNVAVFKETQTPGRTGGYGESSAYWEIDGVKVEAKAEYGTEGITVTVTGVNEHLAKYLYDGYKDGLTVEVWNYYKDITLDALKAGFDAGATVSFSTQPDFYVNAFAKIPDYSDDMADVRIYSKPKTVGDKELLFPYTDEACTSALATDYWVRPADNYGTEEEPVIGPSMYYLLKGHKNAYDCTVTPKDVTFSQTVTHNADIPDDVETALKKIDSNYNVVYIK